MRERLGFAKQTVGLVLPTGYAFNLDGTSLFMSMRVLFIAHAHHTEKSYGSNVATLLKFC
jgi:aerobic C4-dicarboxylate transport protein